MEAVIGQRLARLPVEQRSLLTAAAIQGEQFTAEVVGHVLGRADAEVIYLLSAELGRRHRLTLAVGVERMGELQLAHYRFRHILFRHYLLNHLDAAEQAHLHAATATALETVYASAPDELAARAGQLAWHHRQAGHDAQAVPYYIQAGRASLRLGAYDEAERLFEAGLDLVAADPTLELDLLLGLGSTLEATRGNAAPQLEAVMRRALPLCQTPELWSQQLQVSWHLWQIHFQRDECDEALVWAKRCADLAEIPGRHDEQYRLAAAQPMGATLFRMGKFVEASRCLSAVLPLARSLGAGELLYQVGAEPGVACMVNEALVRWYLGKPAQAEQLVQEGMARARQLEHPFSLAFAMTFATTLALRANDSAATAERAGGDVGTVSGMGSHLVRWYRRRSSWLGAGCARRL